jgi:hypothetical protein
MRASGKHDKMGKKKGNRKWIVICTCDMSVHNRWHKLGYWDQRKNLNLKIRKAFSAVQLPLSVHLSWGISTASTLRSISSCFALLKVWLMSFVSLRHSLSPHHITSRHITQHHIISYRITSRHITSRFLTGLSVQILKYFNLVYIYILSCPFPLICPGSFSFMSTCLSLSSLVLCEESTG